MSFLVRVYWISNSSTATSGAQCPDGQRDCHGALASYPFTGSRRAAMESQRRVAQLELRG
jgi:hypothetical protein